MTDSATSPALDLSKASNPKDAISGSRAMLHLVPSTLVIYTSLAMLEGALKYGKYNWRVAGVRFSVYLDAIDRHLQKVLNGEWADKKTGVPHLASIAASCAIILDANLVGKLIDDRPPAAPVSELLDSMAPAIALLKETFKDHSPHQHTILDKNDGQSNPPGTAIGSYPDASGPGSHP